MSAQCPHCLKFWDNLDAHERHCSFNPDRVERPAATKAAHRLLKAKIVPRKAPTPDDLGYIGD